MDLGKVIRTRRIAEPIVAPPFQVPVRPPVEVPVETVPVGVLYQ